MCLFAFMIAVYGTMLSKSQQHNIVFFEHFFPYDQHKKKETV